VWTNHTISDTILSNSTRTEKIFVVDVCDWDNK
jgi:hypothetical protein